MWEYMIPAFWGGNRAFAGRGVQTATKPILFLGVLRALGQPKYVSGVFSQNYGFGVLIR